MSVISQQFDVGEKLLMLIYLPFQILLIFCQVKWKIKNPCKEQKHQSVKWRDYLSALRLMFWGNDSFLVLEYFLTCKSSSLLFFKTVKFDTIFSICFWYQIANCNVSIIKIATWNTSHSRICEKKIVRFSRIFDISFIYCLFAFPEIHK